MIWETLVSVTVGAVLAGVGAQLLHVRQGATDHAKWVREQRAEAYFDALDFVNKFLVLLQRTEKAVEAEDSSKVPELRARAEAMKDEATSMSARLSLVGPPSILREFNNTYTKDTAKEVGQASAPLARSMRRVLKMPD